VVVALHDEMLLVVDHDELRVGEATEGKVVGGGEMLAELVGVHRRLRCGALCALRCRSTTQRSQAQPATARRPMRRFTGPT
jgi:hypothetical protein